MSEKIRNDKRPSYTLGNENVLDNIDRISMRRNVSPEQLLLIYFDKHYDSIDAYFSRGIESSEPIELRIADANNYLKMLYSSFVRRVKLPEEID